MDEFIRGEKANFLKEPVFASYSGYFFAINQSTNIFKINEVRNERKSRL